MHKCPDKIMVWDLIEDKIMDCLFLFFEFLVQVLERLSVSWTIIAFSDSQSDHAHLLPSVTHRIAHEFIDEANIDEAPLDEDAHAVEEPGHRQPCRVGVDVVSWAVSRIPVALVFELPLKDR